MSDKTRTLSPHLSLKKWHRNNWKNVLSNAKYQIAGAFTYMGIGAILIYFSQFFIEMVTEWLVGRILIYMLLFSFFIWSLFYFSRTWNQLSSVLPLSKSIRDVWVDISDIRKARKEDRDFRSVQVNISRVRRNLRDYINYSEVLTPPIPDYEIDRLQRSIDIFFNSVSQVLFPNPYVFSRAQEKERQLISYYWESREHPTEEEIEEHFEEMARSEEGVISYFDFEALIEFLWYLGDILFSRTKAYSPFSSKHPINVIALGNFFNHWNSVISYCKNTKVVYNRVKQDIEKYYEEFEKRKKEHRQRLRGLADNVLIVVASSVISIIVTYMTRI